MTTDEHQTTPEEVAVYNAAILEGLQTQVALVADHAKDEEATKG